MLDSKKTLKDQTREYILNWIKERNLRPGDRLPPQRELSQILNVSPKIPELVLNELEAEHLVVRRCGRGTFLAGSPETAPRVSAGTRNVFLLLPTLRNPHFADMPPMRKSHCTGESAPCTSSQGKRCPRPVTS
ncbi:MAG: winged helix-turn-helix domain-containing protein [Victivallales bacterium]